MEKDIIYDKDKNLDYEINGILKKISNLFFIPIINNLPARSKELIKKSDVAAKGVIEEAGSHKSMELLYSKGDILPVGNFFQKIIRWIWFDANNAKAVRNRLKLVTRELKKAITEKIAKNKKVNILSIASGSARSVINVLKEEAFKDQEIEVNFLDINQEAHNCSRDIIKKINFSDNYKFNWITDDIVNFANHFENNSLPNIIEMIGLIDYFDDEKVIFLIETLYKKLPDEGILIIDNVTHNKEKKFVENVLGWHLIYRTSEEFMNLILKAGFDKTKVKIFVEPLGVHLVIVAIK